MNVRSRLAFVTCATCACLATTATAQQPFIGPHAVRSTTGVGEGHANVWLHLGRWLGYGFGDGYHACPGPTGPTGCAAGHYRAMGKPAGRPRWHVPFRCEGCAAGGARVTVDWQASRVPNRRPNPPRR